MEFQIKIWRPLLLSWQRRVLVVRENDYGIKKLKSKEVQIFTLNGGAVVDHTKGNSLEILINTGNGIKHNIKPANKEDKEKIINKLTDIIKRYTSKSAFSAEYQKYNREIAKISEQSPYDSLIRKLNIFQNLLLELTQKLDSFKTLIQRKNIKMAADFMIAHNNMLTIKDEMKKQLDNVIAAVYDYHDFVEDKIKNNEGNNINTIILNSSYSTDESNTSNYFTEFPFLSSNHKDFIDDNYNFKKRVDIPRIKCPENIVKEMLTIMTKKTKVPIYFNEPLCMGMRQCEKFAYLDLLNKASEQDETSLQLAYIAGFIISDIYTNIGRTLKPFTPVLSETYEYFDNEKGFRFLSEQVSHYPAITAFIGETENFALFGDTKNEGQFRILKGAYGLTFSNKVTVYLKKTNDCYTYNRPEALLKGLIKPPLHMDYTGTIVINHRDEQGTYAEIEFMEEGWTGTEKGNFKGKIYSSGTIEYIIEGNWYKEMNICNNVGGNKICIIKFDENMEYLKNTVSNYTLPEYSKNLNYLPKELEKVLPKTDSRFRTDIRMLEDGKDLEKAEDYKLHIEQKQRSVLDKTFTTPKYFSVREDSITKEKEYTPNGLYWIERKKGFPNVDNLYNYEEVMKYELDSEEKLYGKK